MLEDTSKTNSRVCNPYLRGIRFEYRTRNYLRKQGWYVVRQPRSMLPDLIAFRNGSILLIECKVHGYLSPAERRKMISLAHKQIGGMAVLAFREEGTIAFRAISRRTAKYDLLTDVGKGNEEHRPGHAFEIRAANAKNGMCRDQGNIRLLRGFKGIANQEGDSP